MFLRNPVVGVGAGKRVERRAKTTYSKHDQNCPRTGYRLHEQQRRHRHGAERGNDTDDTAIDVIRSRRYGPTHDHATKLNRREEDADATDAEAFACCVDCGKSEEAAVGDAYEHGGAHTGWHCASEFLHGQWDGVFDLWCGGLFRNGDWNHGQRDDCGSDSKTSQGLCVDTKNKKLTKTKTTDDNGRVNGQ